MNITLLSVNIQTLQNKAGKAYQLADVAYKNNTFQGKVEGKKILGFGAGKNSFDTLATAQPGTIWEVTVVKNDQGFNDWTNMEPSTATSPGSVAPPAAGAPNGNAVPAGKSTYETSEERAQRQILIVRQSSISSAIAALSVGGKAPLSVEKVIEVARQLEDYVFGRASKGESGFADLPDFDPKDFPIAE